MESDTKHRVISRELATEIAAGKYRQSGRLPSEAQLVTRFGVSRPTISRALRALQDEGLIFRAWTAPASSGQHVPCGFTCSNSAG